VTTGRERLLLSGAGVAAVAAAGVSLAASDFGHGALASAYGLVTSVAPVAFWAVGTTIVTRASVPRIGWLLVAASVLAAIVLAGLSTATGATGSANGPFAAWTILLVYAAYGPTFVTLILAAMVLFPDGRLPARAWRIPAAVPVCLVAASTTARLLRPGPFGDGLPANPLGIDALPVETLTSLFALGPLGIALLGAVGALALIARYLRGVTEVRAQLKWLLASVLPAVILTPISFLDADQSSSSLADVLSAAALLLVPASIGIAITRHRLYDIDRLISRTIGWGLVSGMVVAVFVGVVITLQAVLAGVTQGQTLAVAASTLVAAALFQPLRRLIQHAVDRRFDRSRYDGERTAAAFGARLRNEVGMAGLEADITATIGLALKPVSVGMWVRGEAP
jgi:hypothetical protein